MNRRKIELQGFIEKQSGNGIATKEIVKLFNDIFKLVESKGYKLDLKEFNILGD